MNGAADEDDDDNADGEEGAIAAAAAELGELGATMLSTAMGSGCAGSGTGRCSKVIAGAAAASSCGDADESANAEDG